MKAEEARKISETKEPTFDDIHKDIKMQAESGFRYSMFYTHVSNEKITQLISEGYKISSFKDNMGAEGTKIEW